MDRANAAGKIMQQHGLRADQVTQIRAYADQNLRKPEDPLDSSNRRISLIVQFQIKSADEKSEEPASSEEKSGEAKKLAAEGAAKK